MLSILSRSRVVLSICIFVDLVGRLLHSVFVDLVGRLLHSISVDLRCTVSTDRFHVRSHVVCDNAISEDPHAITHPVGYNSTTWGARWLFLFDSDVPHAHTRGIVTCTACTIEQPCAPLMIFADLQFKLKLNVNNV
uniref:Uncharacterized protein n=1 Tax=Ananas comosus var. bracteatus TaxID=296719 RepID=A0A6V7QM70_ANACO|nr:unnamed protein product [Ananas comosus var. bracteatus]